MCICDWWYQNCSFGATQTNEHYCQTCAKPDVAESYVGDFCNGLITHTSCTPGSDRYIFPLLRMWLQNGFPYQISCRSSHQLHNVCSHIVSRFSRFFHSDSDFGRVRYTSLWIVQRAIYKKKSACDVSARGDVKCAKQQTCGNSVDSRTSGFALLQHCIVSEVARETEPWWRWRRVPRFWEINPRHTRSLCFRWRHHVGLCDCHQDYRAQPSATHLQLQIVLEPSSFTSTGTSNFSKNTSQNPDQYLPLPQQ